MIPSHDLIQRALSADIAYTISRMRVLERLAGNPLGIGYRWVDDTAVALTSRLAPFCRVIGLRAGHEKHVEGLVRWYRENASKPKFEMVPGHYHAHLGRELNRLGFFQSGFHASLIGAAGDFGLAQHDGCIERVTTALALEEYLDAYVAGWEIATKDQAQFKANVRPWLEQPGWSLYMARLDGQPAAAATLFMHDRVGYLADATTAPAVRNRGLQTALLRRRISDAVGAGADIVFSGATPLSTSHRNMERVGLRLQFVRALWTPI